jgi:hypothetical protein
MAEGKSSLLFSYPSACLLWLLYRSQSASMRFSPPWATMPRGSKFGPVDRNATTQQIRFGAAPAAPAILLPMSKRVGCCLPMSFRCRVFRASWMLVEGTAGPSTPLRSGRDDNSFVTLTFPYPLSKLQIPRLPRVRLMTKERVALPLGVMVVMTATETLFIPGETCRRQVGLLLMTPSGAVWELPPKFSCR